LAVAFHIADKLPPDSLLLLGAQVVTASREHSDPLFCSQVEQTMAHMLVNLGAGVVPNPRFHLPEPYRQADLPSRMLDLLVTIPETGHQGLLEVDGAKWHENRRHLDEKRDAVLKLSGIKFIKRASAARCYHDPYGVSTEFIAELKEFWHAREQGVSAAIHR
jgi:hypothetical protein